MSIRFLSLFFATLSNVWISNAAAHCAFFLRSVLVLFCVLFAGRGSAYAGDITLDVLVESRDDLVTIAITNTGRHDAMNVSVGIELDDYRSQFEVAEVIPPNKTRYARQRVRLPSEEGSYPLISTIYYLNEKQRMSVVNVGHFYVGQRRELDVDCAIGSGAMALQRSGTISLPKHPGVETRLALPAEVVLDSVKKEASTLLFSISDHIEGVRANYQIYAIHQGANNSIKICSGRLVTAANARPSLPIPHWSLLCAAAWGLLLACMSYSRMAARGEVSLDAVAAVRYGTSLMLVSLVLLFYLEARQISDYLLPYIYSINTSNILLSVPLSILRFILNCLYFDGANYHGFFTVFALPIFLYMLLGNVWVLRYLILPHKLTDKYWYLYAPFLEMLTRRFRGSGDSLLSAEEMESEEVRRMRSVARLSSLVKIFYVPLVTSWVYNECVFLSGLTSLNFSDFNAVNHAAIRALISIDVAIFAFGYLSELPQLNNQIRSVENTFLGWVVCLMCYPPFNYVSFFPFDYKLFDEWEPAHGTYAKVASFSILLLWAIYVWASIALGPRASNLTNRGIVRSGPYRYVRHPAYSSKVVLWGISGVFLGIYNFFLVVGFVLVYALRAWTEERHLGADPDYQAYCEEVPYRFIPYVV